MDHPKYSLPIGTVLKNGKYDYIITDVLGAGSFGITYKVSARIYVENISTTVYFAVKEFFLKGCYRGEDGCIVKCPESIQAEHKSYLEAFLNEAHLLHDLSRLSKNIIHVNEVFESFGTAYYVMEFIEGGNLLNWVAENGPLEENAALFMMNEICSTVHLIHSNNLLHLDIKPSNIMLSTDSGSDKAYPVLVDFGLAKQFDTNGNPTSSTFSKGATDSYAPKEQYSNIERFNPAIDVYALAATLYFLLTGKHPKSAFNIKPQDIINGLGHKTSVKTRNAIIKAMNPDWDKRTQSAEAFAKMLRGAENEEMDSPIPLKRNTNAFSPKKNDGKDVRHKNKILIFALSTVTIAVIALVSIFVWGKSESANYEKKTDNEEPAVIQTDNTETELPATADSFAPVTDSIQADVERGALAEKDNRQVEPEEPPTPNNMAHPMPRRAERHLPENVAPPASRSIAYPHEKTNAGNDSGHSSESSDIHQSPVTDNISNDEQKRRNEADEVLRQYEIDRLLNE